MNENLTAQLDRALAYQGDGLPTYGEVQVRTKSGVLFTLRYATRAKAKEVHATASGRLEGGARVLTIADDYGTAVTVPALEVLGVELCADYRTLIAGFSHPAVWAAKVVAFYMHITQGDPAQLREMANHPSATGGVEHLLRKVAKEQEARREAELLAEQAQHQKAELDQALADEMPEFDLGDGTERKREGWNLHDSRGWNPFARRGGEAKE